LDRCKACFVLARNTLDIEPVSQLVDRPAWFLLAGVPMSASMVKRPASALDNPVRDSPSSTASQRAKVIVNTPPNGVSAGEVPLCFSCETLVCQLYVVLLLCRLFVIFFCFLMVYTFHLFLHSYRWCIM